MLCKIRYKQKEAPATVTPIDEKRVKLSLTSRSGASPRVRPWSSTTEIRFWAEEEFYGPKKNNLVKNDRQDLRIRRNFKCLRFIKEALVW